MLVRAKVAHIEPETLAYREEGEKFERQGKPYKHVEQVKNQKEELEPKEE